MWLKSIKLEHITMLGYDYHSHLNLVKFYVVVYCCQGVLSLKERISYARHEATI